MDETKDTTLTQDEKSLNLEAIIQYKIKLRAQTDYWKQKLNEGVHLDDHALFKLECFERDWEILDSLEQKLEKEYGMSKYRSYVNDKTNDNENKTE